MSRFEEYNDELLKIKINTMTALLEEVVQECDNILNIVPEEEKEIVISDPLIKKQLLVIQQMTTLLAQMECELFERNHR